MIRGAGGRVLRLERRLVPDDDISRMSDAELKAALVECWMDDLGGPVGTIAALRALAERGDARAEATLAAIREAVA